MGQIKSLGRVFAALSIFAVFSGAPASAASYLVNGSFEEPGNGLLGWTASGNFNGIVFGPDAQDGIRYFGGGSVGSLGFLSQTFSDTAGSNLTVSGWVRSYGAVPNEAAFYFNGAELIHLTNVPAGDWTQYTFSVTATGNDTFTFGFRDDPGYIHFDNFVVADAAVSATPLPAALPLFASGLGALGVAAWRRRKRVVTPAA